VKIKRTISIAAESDYEIHRLAKLWGINVTKARERCYHFAAAHMKDISPEDLPMKKAADIRQANAKAEMLRAE
jgi:hypothetical protein